MKPNKKRNQEKEISSKRETYFIIVGMSAMIGFGFLVLLARITGNQLENWGIVKCILGFATLFLCVLALLLPVPGEWKRIVIF